MSAERYLLTPISVGDIADVEAFARSIIGRGLPAGMYLRTDEHEDEISEVVAQLVDWFRPVNPVCCGACGQRRGQQHAWDCDALPPQRVRRSECLGCGVERHPDEPALHAADCPHADGKGGWGCHACGGKQRERHAESCEHRHERQQRYDPARTSSYALFARYRLNTYYVPDLCRRLLGRNGGRIAERSHSELDERSESGGRRPWETAAPEQDGLRVDLGADPAGGQAGRARARARGAALLGLRPAG